MQRHKMAQRLTPDLIAKIVAEYRGGSSTPQLAKRYGISTTALKRLLHHRDVPLRRYHRLTSAEVETAAELRDAGWPYPRSPANCAAVMTPCDSGCAQTASWDEADVAITNASSRGRAGTAF